MESPNLHHQKQLQDLQLVGSSSSSSLDTEASCYGNQLWSPNVSLNSSNFNQGYTNQSNNSECINLQSHMQNNALIQQDLSLQWQQQQQNLTKLKELSSSSSSDLNDLSEKLLLKTISSGFPIMNDYCSNSSSRNFAAFPHKESFFSQIYPSINVSNLNSTSCSGSHSSTPRTFDMNLQTLDHHNSLMNSVSQEINLGVLYKGNMGFGFGADHYPLQQHHHHHHQPSSCSPSDQFLIKMSQLGTSNNNEHSSETKRPSSLPLQGDARGTARNATATATASKKPRVEPRASCPPLKVRKEKLGDRIAALQQLVAPFGKTDTASVLMEAIGYIKFLQNQVETLSVPYMRSTRTRMAKASQGGSTAEEGNEEAKRDLRSRGLCLVPLSCMSYVTGESVVGGGFWPPPPGFGGGT